jgi:hypothetical protein
MAFNFPAAPTAYQQYTYGTNITYTWTGYAWMMGAIVEPPPEIPAGRRDEDRSETIERKGRT